MRRKLVVSIFSFLSKMGESDWAGHAQRCDKVVLKGTLTAYKAVNGSGLSLDLTCDCQPACHQNVFFTTSPLTLYHIMLMCKSTHYFPSFCISASNREVEYCSEMYYSWKPSF